MTTTPAVAPLSAELDLLMQFVATIMAATSLGEKRVYDLAETLIAQARAAQPKREMPPEMKAAIEEAHKTGATSALLPNGSTVFINYGHDYGDNSHLECTACGGSGHIEDQQARAATVASVEDARDEALEVAALLCETVAADKYDQYKGRGKYAPNNPHRADTHTSGESEGADLCADKIRSLKSSATQEGK